MSLVAVICSRSGLARLIPKAPLSSEPSSNRDKGLNGMLLSRFVEVGRAGSSEASVEWCCMAEGGCTGGETAAESCRAEYPLMSENGHFQTSYPSLTLPSMTGSESGAAHRLACRSVAIDLVPRFFAQPSQPNRRLWQGISGKVTVLFIGIFQR